MLTSSEFANPNPQNIRAVVGGYHGWVSLQEEEMKEHMAIKLKTCKNSNAKHARARKETWVGRMLTIVVQGRRMPWRVDKSAAVAK